MKRREFLKQSIKIGAAVNALPLALGGFPVTSLGRSPLRSALAAGQDNGKILVIIQLAGGNDGLNTLVPHTNQTYYSLRPTLALNRTNDGLLPLKDHDTLAWHSNMAKANTLYDAGKLAILQNVGYPNMDLSHFRGTDIWNNATDRDKFTNTGWIGRMLSELNPDYPPETIASGSQPLAIQIGNSLSNIFLSRNGGMGIAINKLPSEGSETIHNHDDIPSTPTIPYQELEYVRLIERETEVYSYSLLRRSVTTNRVTYPSGNPLATQLSYVAQVIASGFTTKVYLVSQSGYDTHSDQLAGQSALLGQLSEGMLTFQQDLEAFGLADKVAVMTYSEFGRRPKENGTGTDHGTAAPLFVMGTSVRGGIYGNDPDLTNLVNNNLPFDARHDFRNIYSTVMSEWLEIDASNIQSVLTAGGGEVFSTAPSWTNLGLFKSSPSSVSSIDSMGLQLAQNYPNPVAQTTTIEFTLSAPGPVELGLWDLKGREVARIHEGTGYAGVNRVEFRPRELANGIYVYRLKTRDAEVSRSLMIAK